VSRIAEPSQHHQQEQQQQEQQQQVTRGKLVQRLLDASANLPAFLNDLLTTQAVIVAGTEAAAFLIERKQGNEASLRPVAHIRPDDSDQNTRAAAVQAFQSIVQPCIEQGKDGAIEVGSPDGGEMQFCLVTVLRNEGQIVGASAVVTRARDTDRAKQRLQSMQLVAGYFELYSMRKFVENTRMVAERHQQVLQYAGAVATAEGFESAGMNLCNELATRAGASRVAIGWIRRKQVKVRALSHTEKFDKKQELVVLLKKVMEECYDQEEPVRYEPGGQCSPNVTRAASELSRLTGGNIVLSLPLRHREDIVGVLTVEWPAGAAVAAQDEAGVGVAAELLAPQLRDRFDNDRYITTKMCLSVVHLAKLAVGPRHTGIKLLIALLISVVLFIALFRMEYRVGSAVVLSAVETRTITAPFDGFLDEVYFKRGQVVQAGQPLARLKTLEWELQLAAKEAQRLQKRIAADKARAEQKMADVKFHEAEAEEAGHAAETLRYYIQQSTIVAPVTGILVKGDLFERRGMPVRAADPLFEIARSSEDDPGKIAIEAQLKVSERDIQEVARVVRERKAAASQDEAAGRIHDGELATTSFPAAAFKFTITRIVPDGSPQDGENVFDVYATIHDPAAWMHPGLAGEARVNIEQRPLWWIWTHRLIDWLKLKLWI
jgi:hypothetical protein